MPAVLSTPVRVTLIGVGVGVTLIGVLAMYFKRRRRAVKKRDTIVEPTIEKSQWRQLGKTVGVNRGALIHLIVGRNCHHIFR